VDGQLTQQIPLYTKIQLSKLDHLEKYWFI